MEKQKPSQPKKTGEDANTIYSDPIIIVSDLEEITETFPWASVYINKLERIVKNNSYGCGSMLDIYLQSPEFVSGLYAITEGIDKHKNDEEFGEYVKTILVQITGKAVDLNIMCPTTNDVIEYAALRSMQT